MKSKNYRTYYYSGSWRKDVNFASNKVTDDKPVKFTQTVRAKNRKEATNKFYFLYPLA